MLISVSGDSLLDCLVPFHPLILPSIVRLEFMGFTWPRHIFVYGQKTNVGYRIKIKNVLAAMANCFKCDEDKDTLCVLSEKATDEEHIIIPHKDCNVMVH